MGVSVSVAVGLVIAMTTDNQSPKNTPLLVDMRHLPVIDPGMLGAVIGIDSSVCVPGLTALVRVKVLLPIASPPIYANLNPASQAHVPVFCTSQVLVNACPGVMGVLSGMVKSLSQSRP